MIPDAYELKRFVRSHRHRFWSAELLEGIEFAPVWRFEDQAQFDSDEVEGLSRRLSVGPQRLPHPQTIFEVRDRGTSFRSQFVYARQCPDGIEGVWLALKRTPRRWTDIHAVFRIGDDGVADVEGHPHLAVTGEFEQYASVATGLVWRALAILAAEPKVSERHVAPALRSRFSRDGVRGWTWRQVTIDPDRVRSASAAREGKHGSPRWHIRRGHWRRLADGRRVFVRQCEVGDATLGGVVKDYAVEALKA